MQTMAKTFISMLGLLALWLPAIGMAKTPVLSMPGTQDVGTGMATLLLKSDSTGTGYFTLLDGYHATGDCGSGTRVKNGQDSSGAMTPYHGSLPLVANTQAQYTVRNLTQGAAYTACFTADSPTGSNLNQSPVGTTLSTKGTSLVGVSWNTVGKSGFSVDTVLYTSLAFSPDGLPYVAFQNGNTAKATVMQFDGTNWLTVGNAGFSSGSAEYTSLAFSPDGTPHVAYRNSNKATVMKFDGSAWVTVGNAKFSLGDVKYTSLAFAPDGAPTVAYQDSSNNYKGKVVQFDGVNWFTLGGYNFSASQADYTSLAFAPDGTPYVAFRDSSVSSKATVVKYDGTAWVTVGNAGFSAGSARDTSLALAPDGTPYVAYRDSSDSDKATLKKFDGTAWVTVGNGGFSGAMVSDISLAIAPDGTPYVAYKFYNSHDGKGSVMKYDGSNWVAAGQTYFSAGEATYPSLAFTLDGMPFVAYRDGSRYGLATVTKLSGTTLALTSSLNPADYAQSVTFTATITPEGLGTVEFFDGTTSLGSKDSDGKRATLTTSTLAAGNHDISGVFTSSRVFDGSTSPVLRQTINTAAELDPSIDSTAPSQTIARLMNPAAIGKMSASSSSRTWTVRLTNNGGSTATGAQMDSLWISRNGRCQPTVVTGFPISFGDIPAGGSATEQVTLDFTGCVKLAKFNVTLSYSGGGGAGSGSKSLAGVGQ